MVRSTDPEIWTSQHGDVRVSDMSDDHVVATLSFLRRRAARLVEGNADLSAEALLMRVPQYPTLMRELATRGLVQTVRASPAVAQAYDRFAGLIMSYPERE